MAQKRKTLQRFHEAGHAHALTFSCFRQQRFLVRDRSCQWVVEGINLPQSKHTIDVWAYVIMPEHVHLLIRPTSPLYDIGKILATIKQSVHHKALSFLRSNAPTFLPHLLDQQPSGKQHFRFWQRGGGYDRNVIEPEVVWAEIDYIHANPVRRGHCDRVEDWQWSSAADYAALRTGPVTLNRGSLPRTPLG